MPARALGRHAAALFGYVCVAILFAWPLPLHLETAVPGPVAGDTGVYIWNIWVFRHEILAHHHLPFLTLEILALTPPVPLSLHNYTTFANLIAFPLLGVFGTVTTFNVLVLGGLVTSAYAMFLLARLRTGDAAAWIGGLVFGFSPFMSARATGHFSLVLAAPLPLFCYLLHRIVQTPTFRLASLAGVVVAWAFLCDQYYAVYCLMMAGFMAGCIALSVEWLPAATRRRVWIRVLDLVLVCIAGLMAGIVLRGGGRVELLGLRMSVTQLQNPMLAFTVLLGWRLWLTLRPRLSWSLAAPAPLARALTIGALTCAALLVPVLSIGASFTSPTWMGPRVFWRSSAPGVDLLALFAPNPLNPLVAGLSADWLRTLPNGLVENVASVPWSALTLIAVAVWLGLRPPRRWVVFTGLAALLALGPFVRVAGYDTYIPTPWALLRYLPVIGAARVPTRFIVLVMLGLAMLTAMAVEHLRSRSKRPALVVVCAAMALGLELLPAPRTLYSAEVPEVYRIIARDPRPMRVLNLPFGVRDGLTSRGNFSPSYQYFQTVHEKQLLGGYISRLPKRGLARYRRNLVMRTLMRLSEGQKLTPEEIDRVLQAAPDLVPGLRVGYVVVHRTRTSSELLDFATRAFGLTLITTEGELALYRGPAAPPLPTP